MIRRVVGAVVVLVLALGLSGFGSPAKAAPARPAPVAGLVPVGPERLVDTRSALGGLRGPLLGGYPFTFYVAGKAGVPDVGVGSVVLNVTVTSAKSGGYLSVYPTGSARPTASNLNFAAGQTVSNKVVVALGDGGKVSVVSNAAPHVIVDVFGYFPRATGLQGLSPSRVLDTRGGAQPTAGATRTVTIAGRAGVPVSGASAAVLNITAVNPRAAGYLQVWPSGTARPTSSSVNFASGETAAGLVIARLGTNGQIQIASSAGTHILVDILGWAGSGPAYTSLTPTRVADTRSGLGGVRAKIPAGGSATFTIAGHGGVPSQDLRAVEVTMTATRASGSGYLVAYAAGTPRPGVSQLNMAAGRDGANSVTTAVSGDGKISIYSSVAIDVLVDVSGYYLDRIRTTVGVRGVSAGLNTCVVMDTGAAKCWGFNDAFELGDNTSITALTPQQVVGLSSGTRQISSSGQLTCATLISGHVACSGPGTFGEIGDGTENSASAPATVSGLTTAMQVAAASSGACAVTTVGAVYCWGSSVFGGNGAIQNSNVPRLVPTLSRGVATLAASSKTMCAVKTSGAVSCWGYNDYGLVSPIGSPGPFRVPTGIAALPSDVKEVAVGLGLACARSASLGNVYCWGTGILGDGTNDTPWDAREAVAVRGIAGASSVAAADGAACAVVRGEVKCWGSNFQGLLGASDLDAALEPVTVPGLPAAAVSVAGTDAHICAALENGSLWCWGNNLDGALGDGTIRSSAKPVEVVGLY